MMTMQRRQSGGLGGGDDQGFQEQFAAPDLAHLKGHMAAGN